MPEGGGKYDDQATIARLEAQLRYLDLEVKRLRTLSDEQITARRQLDEILSRQEMAEQDLVLAQVELRQTLDRLERSGDCLGPKVTEWTGAKRRDEAGRASLGRAGQNLQSLPKAG